MSDAKADVEPCTAFPSELVSAGQPPRARSGRTACVGGWFAHRQRDCEIALAGVDRFSDHVLDASEELAAGQLHDFRPRHSLERRPIELVDGFDIGKRASRGNLRAVL